MRGLNKKKKTTIIIKFIILKDKKLIKNLIINKSLNNMKGEGPFKEEIQQMHPEVF